MAILWLVSSRGLLFNGGGFERRQYPKGGPLNSPESTFGGSGEPALTVLKNSKQHLDEDYEHRARCEHGDIEAAPEKWVLVITRPEGSRK